MLNIAVCDDNAADLEELSGRLEDFFLEKGVQVCIYRFGGGEELLRQISRGGDCFGAIFLDIRMELNGLEAARLLREKKYGGPLIFVTILGECVYDSFEVSAYDYLVKPVSEEKLEKTLGRLLNSINEDKDGLLMVRSTDGKERVVPFGDILWCEVLDKTVCLHLSDGGSESFRGGIEALENKLGCRFFRCHRSYLVNLDAVVGFGGGTVQMSDNAEVPLSRLRKKAFAEAAARRFGKRGGL